MAKPEEQVVNIINLSVPDTQNLSTFDPQCASSPFVLSDAGNKRKREVEDEDNTHVEEENNETEMQVEVEAVREEPMTAEERASAKHRFQFLEMLEKEESFLSDITTITDLFLERLKDKSVGLDKVDLDQLFANVVDIKQLTSHLVKGMKIMLEENSFDQAASLCALFNGTFSIDDKASDTTVKEFLRVVYKRYVAGHDKARELYQAITKPNTDSQYKVAQFKIKALETDARCHRQSLVDLLMLPVQHLMRYSLHLKDLFASTSTTQPEEERTQLEHLVQFFEQTMSDVNSAQAGMESSAELYKFLGQIQNFSASCFKFGRRHISDLRCKVMGGEKQVKVVVFLMNDSLIVAERRDGSRTSKMKGTLVSNFGLKEQAPYKFHSFCSLHEMYALEVGYDDKLPIFKIASADGSPKKKNLEIHFQASTHLDNRAFLKKIRQQRAVLGMEITDEEDGDERTYEQDQLDFEAVGHNPLSPSAMDKENDDEFSNKRRSVYSRLKKMTSKVNIKLKRTPSRATMSRFQSSVASKSSLSLVNVKRSKSFEDRSKLDNSKPLMKRCGSTPKDAATWASTK